MGSYAVIWRDESARSFVGKLELGASALTLDGSDAGRPVVRTVDYADVELRASGERLYGHRAVAVEDRHGTLLLIASLDRPGTALEFAEAIAAQSARTLDLVPPQNTSTASDEQRIDGRRITDKQRRR